MSHWLTNNFPEYRQRSSLCPSPIMAALRSLESQGIEPQHLQGHWRLPLATLRQPFLRLPSFLARRFWEVALELSNDPALGLAAARHVDPGQLLGLGYLMQLMPTRLEALVVMLEFWPLLAGHVDLRLEQHEGRVHLSLHPGAGVLPAPEEVDYWVSRQIQFLRSWVCASDALLEVRLRRPPPVEPQPWHTLSQKPVYFGTEHNELVLDQAALQEQRPGGSLSIRQALDDALHEYVRHTATPSVLESVSAAVMQELRGELSLEVLAKRLHTTPRTLHRALLRDGWSFVDIIEFHRRYLAHDLLQANEMSVAQIADHLGYSEVRSFTRAFRRWYADTPSQFRARHNPR
ncbi:AraC family transcriptional regulator [Pseudomonas serbica]|jgi:AraC-like DNA-binding protein|uniref:AraC family transcriptional regulator n=1 Tax=Pseudomonas serbica TaxID=2965074 RepID=UPI00237C4559|nr:AraC family transcriptional regulator [Pseudomonas serbica]